MKTLIEALPRDEIGIRTPLFGEGPDREMYPIYVHLDYLLENYANFITLPVPLSEEEFGSLLLHSQPDWQRIWKAWRATGVI